MPLPNTWWSDLASLRPWLKHFFKNPDLKSLPNAIHVDGTGGRIHSHNTKQTALSALDNAGHTAFILKCELKGLFITTSKSWSHNSMSDMTNIHMESKTVDLLNGCVVHALTAGTSFVWSCLSYHLMLNPRLWSFLGSIIACSLQGCWDKQAPPLPSH